jgi:hypothetical protein
VGGEQRGYDGAKKVKGGKRHLLVDTQCLVPEARVHSAQIQDLKKASSVYADSALQLCCCVWVGDEEREVRVPRNTLGLVIAVLVIILLIYLIFQFI